MHMRLHCLKINSMKKRHQKDYRYGMSFDDGEKDQPLWFLMDKFEKFTEEIDGSLYINSKNPELQKEMINYINRELSRIQKRLLETGRLNCSFYYYE